MVGDIKAEKVQERILQVPQAKVQQIQWINLVWAPNEDQLTFHTTSWLLYVVSIDTGVEVELQLQNKANLILNI